MKHLNKTIIIALGMALPAVTMAAPDDDVTIRMMDAGEHATQAVTSRIELPEAATERARERSGEGLEAANRNRNRNTDNDDMEQDQLQEREQEMEQIREREMERERQYEQDREMARDERKDVENNGVDRDESQRSGPGQNGGGPGGQ